MQYDFNQVIDRTGTNSIKHDGHGNFNKPKDLLPLWVADMDFQAPREIGEAVARVAAHNIYGYSAPADDTYFQAVADWMHRRHGWRVEQDWLVKTPGIVFAISMAIRAFTEPGDAVLIQEPVYYPFRKSIEDNGRKVTVNNLVNHNGYYEIDIDDFEAKIKSEQVKLFILCSPHNPVGRVWKREELQRMGELCKRYGVYVVSDEIHFDFVYGGNKHTVFSLAGGSFGDFSVICTAPSKTFNIAGLQVSNIFIQNKELRERFQKQIEATGYDEINICGLAACQAAYTYGEAWPEELLQYLESNRDYVRDCLNAHGGKLRLVEPEGTYLVWVDCRGLGLTVKELHRRIEEEARLWLDDGDMFGKAGEGYERINIACPRRTLEEAMQRLIKID